MLCSSCNISIRIHISVYSLSSVQVLLNDQMLHRVLKGFMHHRVGYENASFVIVSLKGFDDFRMKIKHQRSYRKTETELCSVVNYFKPPKVKANCSRLRRSSDGQFQVCQLLIVNANSSMSIPNSKCQCQPLTVNASLSRLILTSDRQCNL